MKGWDYDIQNTSLGFRNCLPRLVFVDYPLCRKHILGPTCKACFCDKIFVNRCFENMYVYLSFDILKIILIFDETRKVLM